MSVLRPIYDWTLRQAEKPYVGWIIFLMAMIEPCLLPTPPDVLLVPAIIARREKAWFFATVCAAGSLLGALIGYSIGALAMATLGEWLITAYSLQDKVQQFHDAFAQWGTLVIIVKAAVPFIPGPFFLVTLVSGAIHFSPLKFAVAFGSVRLARFYGEAWLLRRYGEPIQYFIEKQLNWIVLAGVTILVAWFVLAHNI